MKKLTPLIVVLIFLIAGTATKQAQAISLSPKAKCILGAFFGVCALDSLRIGAVVLSRESNYKCCDSRSAGHRKVPTTQFIAFPGATFSICIASILGISQQDYQCKGTALSLFGLLYGYISYKLFMFAEKEKKQKKSQNLL